MRKFIVFVFAIFIMTSYAYAQTNPAFTPEKIEAIETLIIQHMETTKVPGLAYALIEDGEFVHGKGFGSANRDGDNVTAHTAFNLGSVSKSFAALAVMKSAEMGKLTLDAPVTTYLPAFRTKDKAVSDTITIRHLLTQTSGFTMYTGNQNHHINTQSPDALSQAMAKFRTAKLHAKPGAKYQYSNANYQTLGTILERIWHKPYEHIIRDVILDPLSMGDSFVLNPHSSTTQIAEPHLMWLNRPKYYDWQQGRQTIPQGGVYASVHDVAKYLEQYMAAEPALISKQGVQEMFTLPDTATKHGYGFGWFVQKQFKKKPDNPYIYHNGLSPGYTSFAGFMPDRKIGFVIVSNASAGFVGGNIHGMQKSIGGFILSGSNDTQQARPINSLSKNIPMLLGICSLPILIFIWAVFFIRRRTQAKPVSILRIVVPTILLVLTAWALGIAAPKSFGANLGAARLFNPDIGWALTVATAACLIWALLRLTLITRTPNI